MLLITLKINLVFEHWKQRSYKKNQILEKNLFQIIAQCINQVTLNNVLY
jgi:hypothetical protein